MTYLSVCSGIEAATVAWHPLGWQPWAFAEIEKFPSAVLAHHYPTVPNLGDLTRFHEWQKPCLCVTGVNGESQRRSGTTGQRHLGRCDVHTEHDGQAYSRHHGVVRDESTCARCGGAAIDLLVGGTPCQSFSVAGLRAGLADPRGNLALTYLAVVDRYRPRWVVWENVPGVLSSGGGRDFGAFLGGLAELGYGFAYRVLDAQYFGLAQRRQRVFVVGYLGDWRRAAAVLFERESLSGHSAPRREAGEDVVAVAGIGSYGGGIGSMSDVSPCLQACGGEDERGVRNPIVTISSTGDISHCVNAGGMGRIDYETETLIAHAFDARQSNVTQYGDQSGPLDTDGHSIAVAFHENQRATSQARQVLAVRRLTVEECEFLQGFPRGYTAIPYRGKPAADGPRYKALGNSMAVPVMRWIGERIQMVDDLTRALEATA